MSFPSRKFHPAREAVADEVGRERSEGFSRRSEVTGTSMSARSASFSLSNLARLPNSDPKMTSVTQFAFLGFAKKGES